MALQEPHHHRRRHPHPHPSWILGALADPDREIALLWKSAPEPPLKTREFRPRNSQPFHSPVLLPDTSEGARHHGGGRFVRKDVIKMRFPPLGQCGMKTFKISDSMCKAQVCLCEPPLRASMIWESQEETSLFKEQTEISWRHVRIAGGSRAESERSLDDPRLLAKLE